MIDQWRNKIICGDARELIKKIPAQAVDCVITDPVWPNTTKKIPGWEDPYGLFKEVAKFFPKIAHRVIVHLNCLSDPRFLSAMPSELPFVRVLSLRYARPCYIGRFLMDRDIAYVFGDLPKAGPRRTILGGETVFTATNEEKPNHPCPRRLQHVKWLVSKYTDENDLVLDPFAGSGTTTVACEICGRDYIGFEIVPEYCELAEKRLQIYRQQLKLNIG